MNLTARYCFGQTKNISHLFAHARQINFISYAPQPGPYGGYTLDPRAYSRRRLGIEITLPYAELLIKIVANVVQLADLGIQDFSFYHCGQTIRCYDIILDDFNILSSTSGDGAIIVKLLCRSVEYETERVSV